MSDGQFDWGGRLQKGNGGPLPRGQGLDTKKRTIDDRIAIKDHKFHTFLHLVP